MKICAAGKKNIAPYIDDDLNAGSDGENETTKSDPVTIEDKANIVPNNNTNIQDNTNTELYVPLNLNEEKKQQAPSKISLISREQISELVNKIQKAYETHVPSLETVILSHPYAQAENLPEGRYGSKNDLIIFLSCY